MNHYFLREKRKSRNRLILLLVVTLTGCLSTAGYLMSDEYSASLLEDENNAALAGIVVTSCIAMVVFSTIRIVAYRKFTEWFIEDHPIHSEVPELSRVRKVWRDKVVGQAPDFRSFLESEKLIPLISHIIMAESIGAKYSRVGIIKPVVDSIEVLCDSSLQTEQVLEELRMLKDQAEITMSRLGNADKE